MLRLPRGVVGNYPFLLLLVTCLAHPALAQLETATVSGQVVDPSGLSLSGAHVKLVDIDRDTSTVAITNNSGLYTFASVRPGRYRMEVDAPGFRIVNVTGLTLNVQDHIEQNFRLQVGSVAESVTVEASAATIDTTDATVSTVVDRQFAENLPMNGRSFQTLIELTPGVVLTTSNAEDNGQFSINGQRAASNYWMVDGVSANIGIGADTNGSGNPGNGLGGSLGSFSAFGGTNSLVSIDAMQEFRIETSTYAPEFGRTPGGQISIVTRSGENQFHGTVFDYLRNDALDANDWFNGVNILNPTPLPKAKERQNDFGGTFSGPILKNTTFFFFSYEGLRLDLPQTSLTYVPDANFTPGGTTNSRQNSIAAMQPYMNAFPLPNANSPEVFVSCDPTTDPTCPPSGQEASGTAQFNASYSNPATLDAWSIRIDRKLGDRLTAFGRYNYSPSEVQERGAGGISLSAVSPIRITTQTLTMGSTLMISPNIADDLRFNYSQTNSLSYHYLDTFGGGVPLTSLQFPSPFTSQNAGLTFNILSPSSTTAFQVGQNGQNRQRQINIVDSLSLQKGSHNFKVGVDFRRLSPLYNASAYGQAALFLDVPSAQNGNPDAGGYLISNSRTTFLFRNLGLYAQDTWRMVPCLTLTYGLRWDVDFVPRSLGGPGFPAITGFNLDNLSNLALAPAGTAPYSTTYGNFAPRVGLAYQLTRTQNWQTVIRGGGGVFYDLATSEMGNQINAGIYPFGGFALSTGTFPFNSATSPPPPITPPNATNGQSLNAFDPHLKLPYTLEWNIALEEGLGHQQSLSVSYIGASGSRLLQTAVIYSPNPNLFAAQLVTNSGNSNYNALQAQFQRRLSGGLQALGSYIWSHSIDTGSAGSTAVTSNNLVVSALSANRASSDFDIRDAFSAALTYDIPALKRSVRAKAIMGGWSVDNIIEARSAPPVTVDGYEFNGDIVDTIGGYFTYLRPDLVPGRPLYLYGSQYPGTKAFNPAALTAPPIDPVTGIPLRNGDLGRNALRGFGAAQWDFAVHRDFRLHESVRLQFRAEIFNVLNHPNFGQPDGLLNDLTFGLSTQMLNQSLNGQNLGGGAFDPLYQIGGPRSIQLALKLAF